MPSDYMKMPKNYMKDTWDIEKEAKKPVRKTEAGRYKGIEEPNAPDREADVFAGKGSVADKLRLYRKKVESGSLGEDE